MADARRGDKGTVALAALMLERGRPAHIRSDTGPEFVTKAVRQRTAAVGASTACIEPGSPWESGDAESFNSKLRGELPCGEIFSALKKAQILIEACRRHDNAIRPHSVLRWRPPAPEVLAEGPAPWPTPAPPDGMAEKAVVH